MAELEPFIENAMRKSAANRGFSLQDIAAFTGGVLGMGGAGLAGKPGYAPLALLPFAVSRMQKSPGAATAIHGGGNIVERLMALRGITLPARTALAEE